MPFQFTPLREGRPGATIVGSFIRLISIHAPPRGATAAVDAEKKALDISIHAPPRGATDIRLLRSRRCYFNSRPSARGDADALALRGHGDLISIHAPPRGATLDVGFNVSRPNISIHAPPRGATARGWGRKHWKTSFQFTPLREGRRQADRHGLQRGRI